MPSGPASRRWPSWHSDDVDFEVREASESDLDGLRECYLRSWRGAYSDFLDPSVLEDEIHKRAGFDWSAGIESTTAVVLVAVSADGRVLGVARADEGLPAPRDLLEVTMLYVDPVAWGSPVAADLLDAAVAWIARQGHPWARLRAVEGHRRARRFYEREGWQLDPDLEPAHNFLARLIYYRLSLPNGPSRRRADAGAGSCSSPPIEDETTPSASTSASGAAPPTSG